MKELNIVEATVYISPNAWNGFGKVQKVKLGSRRRHQR